MSDPRPTSDNAGELPPLTPASVRLAALWAALAPGPLILSGLLGRERAWRIEDAFLGILALAACVLPWLWAACGEERGGLRQRGAELLLLLVGTLPPLALAASFSAVSADAAARAILYLLFVLVLLLLLLLGTRGWARSTQTVVLFGWALALPIAILVWGDLVGPAPSWAHWIAPLSALPRLAAGHSPWAPLLGVLIVAVVLSLPLLPRALRRVPRPVAAALVVGTLLVAGDAWADPQVVWVRPLTGDRVRPGEPYPLALELRARGEGRVAARSFGHRFGAPLREGPLRLIGTPLGGGHRLELGWRDGSEWRRLAAEIPEPRILRAQDLLVGSLGDATSLTAALTRELEAVTVALRPADLSLLARAGQSIDVVVAARGSARQPAARDALRAWAAAGGVLVLDDRVDLLGVVAPSGHTDLASPSLATQARGTDLRMLGAGVVLGPLGSRGLAQGKQLVEALDPWLTSRTERRARRMALRDAAHMAPSPQPSRGLERTAALAALAAAVVLVILAGLAGRLTPGAFLGGAALLSVVLAWVLRSVAAPAAPVYAASTQVVEVPAGARIAQRLEFVSVVAPRPTEASITLRGWAPPVPIFDSGLTAVRSRGEVVSGPSGKNPRLELPLGSGIRTFARLDAMPLSGVIRVVHHAPQRRVRVENRTGQPLDQVYALVQAGLYPLPDLPAGARVDIDLGRPPIPFARWRSSALDETDFYWRRLVTASLSGRDLSRSLILIGRGAPQRAIRAGVAEERPARPLFVVVARQGR